MFFSPIFLRFGCNFGVMSSSIESNLSKMILKSIVEFCSNFPIRSCIEVSIARKLLSFVNVLIIAMFTWIALLLFNTLESMATPFSVNTLGEYLAPPYFEFEERRRFLITLCTTVIWKFIVWPFRVHFYRFQKMGFYNEIK